MAPIHLEYMMFLDRGGSRCRSTRKYTWPGSNWRPSACEADVIATRPQVLLIASKASMPFDSLQCPSCRRSGCEMIFTLRPKVMRIPLAVAAIAQLGERQTEDLKVPGSIPGLGIFADPGFACTKNN